VKATWIYINIERLDILPRSSWKTLATNDSMNDLDLATAPKIQKSKLGVKKPEGINIKWSNPYGNQPTHLLATLKALILIFFPIILK